MAGSPQELGEGMEQILPQTFQKELMFTCRDLRLLASGTVGGKFLSLSTTQIVATGYSSLRILNHLPKQLPCTDPQPTL